MTADAIGYGGLPRTIAKRGYEQALWARVAAQRWVEQRRPGAVATAGGAGRREPHQVSPTAVLHDDEEWKAAAAEARILRLPLHPDRPKNWDALGALSVVLGSAARDDLVLDAGSARYSPVLPWLRLYGYQRLLGLNLEFGKLVCHQGVEFRYGDITATDLPPSSVGAITCLSVIEHGVPVAAFLSESARILRPGGVLVISTDFDQAPADVTGKYAYGQQVHIFDPDEIAQLVTTAEQVGLRLRGGFDARHETRPIHWKRQDLRYTYVRLTFDRVGAP